MQQTISEFRICGHGRSQVQLINNKIPVRVWRALKALLITSDTDFMVIRISQERICEIQLMLVTVTYL